MGATWQTEPSANMGIFFGLIPIAVLIQRCIFSSATTQPLATQCISSVALRTGTPPNASENRRSILQNIGTAAGKQYAGIADICYQLG